MALKASKRGCIPSFMVMDVLKAANQKKLDGEAVYHLEIGQPGTGAPRGVVGAVGSAVTSEQLGYTDAFGLPSLREAISKHYRDHYKFDVPVERIAVTAGSSAGFVLSFLAAFDMGDRVAVISPGYPCYRHILQAFGITPVIVQTDANSRFQPTPGLLETVLPLDGLIIASPSNPSGTMLLPEELGLLSDFCDVENIRLISDEIYHGISYERQEVTATSLNSDAIVINSFSKYFSMTGWRIGWMVIPPELLHSVECLQQNLFICAPAISQVAAEAAFHCNDELEKLVAQYRRNRDFLIENLPDVGFDRCAPADGAFYIYADVSAHTNNSEKFCQDILNATGVALTPGCDFDPNFGKTSVRISYAEAPDVIEQAIAQLQRSN